MKLERLLTNKDRQRVEAALGSLQSTHSAYEAKLQNFCQITGYKAELEARHNAGVRSLSIAGKTAHDVAALRVQIGQVTEKRAAMQPELESARQNAVEAIRRAGHLIYTVCAPLRDQFKRRLADALRPFCWQPEGAASTIETHGTELPDLLRFLQRGQYISKTAGPQEIEWLSFELRQTLRCILDGGEIWKLRSEIVTGRKPLRQLAPAA